MSAEVFTAAISLVGTLVGTLGGIALSSNLTNYRIEQLEKKVDWKKPTAPSCSCNTGRA